MTHAAYKTYLIYIFIYCCLYIYIYLYIYLGCRIRYFCYTLYIQYIYAIRPLCATKGLTIGTSLFLFPLLNVSFTPNDTRRVVISAEYTTFAIHDSRIKDRGRKMLRCVRRILHFESGPLKNIAFWSSTGH